MSTGGEDDVIDFTGSGNSQWLHILKDRKHKKSGAQSLSSHPSERKLMLDTLKRIHADTPNLIQFLTQGSIDQPHKAVLEITQLSREMPDLKPKTVTDAFCAFRKVFKQ
jgi:hypothetical protein